MILTQKYKVKNKLTGLWEWREKKEEIKFVNGVQKGLDTYFLKNNTIQKSIINLNPNTK